MSLFGPGPEPSLTVTGTEANTQQVNKPEVSPATSLPDEPTTSKSVIVVDHGDMILKLEDPSTNSTVGFKVASQVLCSTSKVFLAMLGSASGFKESAELSKARSTGGIYVQVLEDDDAGALELVLNAIHFRRDHTPGKIEFEQLVQVAVICDKYDFTDTLNLLMVKDNWTSQWADMASEPGYEAWLFVAFVFRNADIFTRLSREFISKGVILESGSLKLPTGSYMLEYLPPRVVSEILTRRKQMIDAMLRLCDSVVQDYSDWETLTIVPKCRQQWDKELCDCMMMGYLHRNVHRCRLQPEVREATIRRSSNDIYTVLHHFNIKALSEHDNCSPTAALRGKLSGINSKLEGLSLNEFISR